MPWRNLKNFAIKFTYWEFGGGGQKIYMFFYWDGELPFYTPLAKNPFYAPYERINEHSNSDIIVK